MTLHLMYLRNGDLDWTALGKGVLHISLPLTSWLVHTKVFAFPMQCVIFQLRRQVTVQGHLNAYITELGCHKTLHLPTVYVRVTKLCLQTTTQIMHVDTIYQSKGKKKYSTDPAYAYKHSVHCTNLFVVCCNRYTIPLAHRVIVGVWEVFHKFNCMISRFKCFSFLHFVNETL